jgi:hypothetical protein
MNKKTMYASVAMVVIIVVVVGSAGGYMLLNSGDGNTVKVADATNLQYDVDVTYQETTSLAKFTGKNLGSNMILRIDLSGSGQDNYTNIINYTDQTAWRSTNGIWTDVSTTYDAIMNIGCGKQWTSNVDALANWSGTGDCTYTDSDGVSYRIYNVVINPALADSLFQHTT